MGYAVIFVGASLTAMLILWFVPASGAATVRARLGALEAAGPGLVPLEASRVQQIRDRRKSRSERRRKRARCLRVLRLLLPVVAALGLEFVAAWSLGLPRVGLVTLGLVVMALAALLVRHQARLLAVSAAMPQALLVMAGHLRDTNSFLGSLEAAAQQAPRAVAREIARVRAAIAAGATEEQAFTTFARRNPVPEAQMLASALSSAQQRGQQLAVALFDIQELMEARVRVHRQARKLERPVHALAWALMIVSGSLALRSLDRAGGLTLTAALVLGLFCVGSLGLNRLVVAMGKGS